MAEGEIPLGAGSVVSAVAVSVVVGSSVGRVVSVRGAVPVLLLGLVSGATLWLLLSPQPVVTTASSARDSRPAKRRGAGDMVKLLCKTIPSLILCASRHESKGWPGNVSTKFYRIILRIIGLLRAELGSMMEHYFCAFEREI